MTAADIILIFIGVIGLLIAFGSFVIALSLLMMLSGGQLFPEG